MALARLRVILLLGAPLLLFSNAEAREVGVSYGMKGDDLPDPESVVQLLMDNGITMVRIYDADETVLTALADTGIKVMIMMPNDELEAAASDPSYADQWVQDSVAEYYPDTLINGVAVGNEVFKVNPELTQQLVPAMTNVQQALAKLGLAGAVKVSTPIHFSALNNTYPPSSASFGDDIAQSAMKPMLEFLLRTGSYLSINPYPFFALDKKPNIDLQYALGDNQAGVRDNNNRLMYHSLLDAMRDATYHAMEKLMVGNLNVMATVRRPTVPDVKYTESGWPSGGNVQHGKQSQPDGGSLLEVNCTATVANAKAYNNYLINRVLVGKTGTPYRLDADMDVYIFALFNENQKGDGPDDVEQHFGLFDPNMTKVYEFDFQKPTRV